MQSLHFPFPIGQIHFVGIGGIGMSGIAEILHSYGLKVQGSDITENANTVRLQEKGVPIFIGHNEKHVQNVGAVVVSSAVQDDNPELIAARSLRIPQIARADMLAEIMRVKWAIAVGGTHGKTTTTSLVGHILEQCNLDPTVINGGIINAYNTNVRLGDGDWVVVEADESDGSFLRLPACINIITNMDPEHLDYYGSAEAMRDAFAQFIDNLPFYGLSVVCTDHAQVQRLIAGQMNRKFLTYGTNPQAYIQATNIQGDGCGMRFDLHVGLQGAQITYKDVFLPMYGEHNVLNSLAAMGVGSKLGLRYETMIEALQSFSGVKRRFTLCDEVDGVRIIDDYAHHPVEIQGVLSAARLIADGHVIVIAQPHRYSRLADLFDEFAVCFHNADQLWIADVYAAGEEPVQDINAQSLVAAIAATGHQDVRYLPSPDKLAEIIKAGTKPGDLVVFLGAGSITKWANALPTQLRADT
ncbi:MAG: UDP-N-acetylmuramate--L-alanine ligase [Pseudomonadota bacterium]